MPLRKGLLTILALTFCAAAGTPVWAQYRGQPGYGYYGDPAYGGSAYYAPQRGYAAPPPGYPAYSDQGYGYEPQSGLGDPPSDGNPYSGRADVAGGGYDLGPNANRTTREEVPNPTRQPPGTIVIDTASRHLYFTEPNGEALQYGIGVGREGFAWKGTAKVARKAEWPGWTPPAAMLKRRPDLPLHMEGGIDNPLGARALYLYNGKGDTGFRIHGTNEPDTIGQAVSSGCIRMMNADVIDLYRRVPVGTRVVVL